MSGLGRVRYEVAGSRARGDEWMPEASKGRTRADEFDVETILPDLTELDPDLSDLLDLTGPPPDPLPTMERPPRPPAPPAREDRPAPVKTAPTPPPAPAPQPPLPPAQRADGLEIPDFVSAGPQLATEHGLEDEWSTTEDVEFEFEGDDARPAADLIPPFPPDTLDEPPAPVLEGPTFIDRIVEAHEAKADEAAADRDVEERAVDEEPKEEPEPPRLPTVPVGELDGFATQLGANLGAEAEAEPDHRVEVAVAALDDTATFEPTPGQGVGPLAAAEPLGPSPCVEPTPVTHVSGFAPRWRRHLGKGLAIAVTGIAAGAWLLTGPGQAGDSDDKADEDRPAPSQAVAEGAGADANTSIVAEATIPLVDVYDSPEGGPPKLSLEHPTEVGGPLVFLVKEQRGEWLEVFLPVSPNGGDTGWVKANHVRLSKHDYKVAVHLGAHRLDLYQAGKPIFQADIAVGTRDAPAPGETFYIKELLKPPNPDTVYGNYAFGLSGFSNALEKFSAGEGVVGIHGTNDPALIGQDVGEGSIRMTNEDMLELVGTLPLGTPVEIRP